MRIKLLLVILFIRISCFAQTTEHDFTLSVSFNPSFISQAALTIHSESGGAIAYLSITSGFDHPTAENAKASLDGATISGLTNFFKTYPFKIKGSIDTLGSLKVSFNGKDTVTVYD